MRTSTLRTRFLLKYKAMSKTEREEIVLQYMNQPYTWNPIMVEVYNYTHHGYEMLKQLEAEGKL